MVTMTKEEYAALQLRNHRLAALEYGGVNNWEWYGESLEIYARNEGCQDWNTFEDAILCRKKDM